MMDTILRRLSNVKRTSNGYTALCPAHNDRNPSLSISVRETKILFKCFAGCRLEAIVFALGLEMKDLFIDHHLPFVSSDRKGYASNKSMAVPVAIYPYTDADGMILYEYVRYEPKAFRQRRPDGAGGYIYNLDGVIRVPYRLPEMIMAVQRQEAEIWLAEGEKDADNLCSLGISASSFKGWSRNFNHYIKNARVVLFRDHDASGVIQANEAAEAIAEVANSIKIIDLFDGEPILDKQGPDISDWIDTHRSLGSDNGEILEKLSILVDGHVIWRVPPYGRISSHNFRSNSPALKIKAMSDIETKIVRWLIEGLVPFGFFTLCDGIEGIGKTYAMLDIATRYSRGLEMPISGAVLPPGNVLIMSEEDSPEYVLKPRLEKMGASMSRIFIIDEPFLMNRDGFAKLEEAVANHRIKFVVIDPIMSYTGGANIDSTRDVRPITDRLNKIAAAHGCAIIGIRHINKAKGFGESRSAGAHSVAWLQGSRSALIIGCDPADKNRRAIGQHKLNLAAENRETYGFQITRGGVFEWTGISDLSIEKMLSNNQNTSVSRGFSIVAARDFLTSILTEAGGSIPQAEIVEKAVESGISERTLIRAKRNLDIKSEKAGMTEGWIWSLPTPLGAQNRPAG